jgi:hypothetical protein
VTLFEYITVAVSIGVSLCVVRLLDGLSFSTVGSHSSASRPCASLRSSVSKPSVNAS